VRLLTATPGLLGRTGDGHVPTAIFVSLGLPLLVVRRLGSFQFLEQPLVFLIDARELFPSNVRV